MIHSGRIANRAVLPHCKLWMWDREIHCGLEGFSFSPFGFCFRSHILIQWGRLKGGWLVALGLFHLLSLKSKQTLISGLSSTFSFFIKTGHVWKACLCSVAAPPDGGQDTVYNPTLHVTRQESSSSECCRPPGDGRLITVTAPLL